MSDPQHDIKVWMQAELSKRPHGTKGRLAKFVGVRADAITRMMNTDPKKEHREIKAHELPRIREFFSEDRPTIDPFELSRLFEGATEEAKQSAVVVLKSNQRSSK